MNIYINMFLNEKVQTQGISLQRQSLYDGSDSGMLGRHGNPITQRLVSFRFLYDSWHIRGVKVRIANSLSIDVQDRKNNYFRLISGPSQVQFDCVVPINKQKYVNIPPPRTPFYFLWPITNCAILYLHFKDTKNSLVQQGYEKHLRL